VILRGSFTAEAIFCYQCGRFVAKACSSRMPVRNISYFLTLNVIPITRTIANGITTYGLKINFKPARTFEIIFASFRMFCRAFVLRNVTVILIKLPAPFSAQASSKYAAVLGG
jgi:hypothetical protein